ncbi:MAG: PD40 domain-containing protein [Gammaproteobacteria bacterium]|nr:PD40 domain-containing protein [Gammaproteobacteria bacterium]
MSLTPFSICRIAPLLALPFLTGCTQMQLGKREEMPKVPSGVGQVSIESVTNDAEAEYGLRVAPNGQHLIFNQGSGAGRSGFLAGRSRNGGPAAIVLMELGKPGKTMLSQQGARDPAWFSDSRGFAFSMEQGSQSLLARSTVGEGIAAIQFISPTPCTAYDQSPSVSPSGAKVLFVTITKPSEAGTIALMDLKASESKCKMLFGGSTPQWAPSGSRFAFARGVNGRSQIFTFDESKNQLTQITFGDFNNFDPAWSPDGRRLVFVTTRNGNEDLYTIGEDGGSLVQITQGPTNDRSPTWSSTGDIYFVSDAGGQADIWRAQVRSR